MELAGLGAIVAVTIRSALRTPSPAAHLEDVGLLVTMLRVSLVAIAMLSAIVSACAGDPLESVPRVAKRGDQTAAQFDWPWCQARIPPLTNCGEFGSLADIGGFISEQNVCFLISAMQKWLAERGWERIENVRVCRTSRWVDPPNPEVSISLDRPKVWTTHIIADIPEHGVRLWVFLREDSGEVTIDIEKL